MAKIHIDRAYIESFDDDESHKILIHIKNTDEYGNIDHIYAGKVELGKNIFWIYMATAENGDLMINNSAGMENNKWNHITKEIIRESDDQNDIR
jgi:hypothetical protein